MQPLPPDFLAKIAREYDLTPEQAEVFVVRYSSKKDERYIVEELFLSHNAFRTRMAGVYRKFSIGGKGPGKARRLHDFLMEKYKISAPAPTTEASPGEPDIKSLVQELREKIRPYIQERCGTMRVLDMSQPIALGNIYTNVNILEKILGRRRLALAELWKDADPENFDRLGLSRITQKRVPGLEAVELYPKLMVLGKPGAGKTTFLKYLAMQCIEGEFQAKQVPIFITLKEFAERREKPDLVEFIARALAPDGVVKEQTAKSLTELLRCGKALILLDGLDEVREEDAPRVIQQVEEISKLYPQNQFVITCRIAAREYTFEKFTEVEVADFDKEQIRSFAANWFKAKAAPEQAERFWQQLKENEQIRELATNPLLLTLLCLEFEDGGDFPSDRAELYKRAIATLLRKWDAKRGIRRDIVYKKLTVQRKEDLLGQVALTTFKTGDYFFKQGQLERYIAAYIRNLPDAQADPEALLLDSEAVLKSIEAQHGLLVERARSIYSFSHLTFQEYFAARQIVYTSEPQALETALQSLADRIAEKRWREVLLLAVGMLPSADRLLRLMKQQVDGIIAKDDRLQKLLVWVERKSLTVDSPYKPAAVRAFYVGLNFGSGSRLSRDLARDLDQTIDLDQAVEQILDRAIDQTVDRAIDLDQAIDQTLDLDRVLSLDLALYQAIDRTIDLALDLNTELVGELKQLKVRLPSREEDYEQFKQWWETEGKAWTEQLRAVSIKYRNVGHDWQFSKEQRELLRQYYDANHLLVKCLNSDCYVSREVREEIEDTLLLPHSN